VGKVDAALKLFQAMTAQRCEPSIVTYNSVMHALGRAGRVDEACNVFKQMITKGVRPDSVSYNILIDCLGKAGQLDRAFELFEQSNGSITTHTYNTLMNSLGKQGEVQGLPEQLLCHRLQQTIDW